MMSQLMLLNASAGGAGGSAKQSSHIQKQQAEIMHNIQKLIDKPIILQTDGSIEMSAAKEELRSSMFKGTVDTRKVSEREKDEDDIQDEIGSDLPPPSGDEDSIKESIEESRQSDKQLSSARRMLGSEQAIIRSSKDLISGKRSQSGSMFDRGSFGNY